ncbi:hypothetical protein [Streptomyces sp. NPDC017890]|uniref:hypothetical protein n=1 Tax=Streptomyces sp. NPDC017890 TaxID=3365015 RepID=UPI0037A2D6F7
MGPDFEALVFVPTRQEGRDTAAESGRAVGGGAQARRLTSAPVTRHAVRDRPLPA